MGESIKYKLEPTLRQTGKTLSYDANGNVVQTKTAQGITENWAYDALNRNISHTDGAGNTDTKSYDALDNLTTSLDALSSGTNPYLGQWECTSSGKQ